MKTKIIVIKFGGSIFEHASKQLLFLRNIKIAINDGYIPVIIHGGGKEITKWFDKVGIETRFVKGLRYTDQKSIEIVEMVLSGKINKHLADELNRLKVPAIGLSGRDAHLVVARKRKEFGLVGTVNKVNVDFLHHLIKIPIVPIISSVCTDGRGTALNVNADEVAYAIASALKADKLIFMTDTKGILRDVKNEKTNIKLLNTKIINELLKDNVIKGGMLPKIEASVRALNRGVKEIDIIDGRINGVLNKVLKGKTNCGTRIIK